MGLMPLGLCTVRLGTQVIQACFHWPAMIHHMHSSKAESHGANSGAMVLRTIPGAQPGATLLLRGVLARDLSRSWRSKGIMLRGWVPKGIWFSSHKSAKKEAISPISSLGCAMPYWDLSWTVLKGVLGGLFDGMLPWPPEFSFPLWISCLQLCTAFEGLSYGVGR